MKPKWQKLASLAQEICTLYFQFFGAAFASKGYPLKNIFNLKIALRACPDKVFMGFSKRTTSRIRNAKIYKLIYSFYHIPLKRKR